jgi:hypothetical protein
VKRRHRLPPLANGVADPLGFSGDDVTSALKATLAGAVDGAAPGGLLELRIHGVGGANPVDMLEHPHVVQVGGDYTAGFYRRWFPDRPGAPRDRRLLEAYGWGGLTSKATSRAFWLLLLPFLICNLAAWTHPADAPEDGRKRSRAAIVPVIRLAGLALTLLFTASLITLSLDTSGWQGGEKLRGHLPRWLRWLVPAALGPRVALLAVVPAGALVLLFMITRHTVRSYESWRLPLSAGSAERAEQWPLAAPGFWHGSVPVLRQAALHLGAGLALLGIVVASLPSAESWAKAVLDIAGGVVLGTATVLLASPYAGRPGLPRRNGRLEHRVAAPARWRQLGLAAAVGALGAAVAAVGVVARVWWRPHGFQVGIGSMMPGDNAVHLAITGAESAVVLALFALVALSKGIKCNRDVAGWGFLPALVTALALLSGEFLTGGLNAVYASWLGGVRPIGANGNAIRLPDAVIAAHLALLVFAGSCLILAVGAVVFWWRAPGLAADVRKAYPSPSAGARRVQSLARTWAKARLPDFLGTAAWILAGPALLAMTLLEVGFVTRRHATVSCLEKGGFHGLVVVAGSLGTAAIVSLIGLTRQAYSQQASRRQIGVLWDVATFWPRASQPFAPPCYAERSIPEVVNRLRRAMGDDEEPADPAVLPDEPSRIAQLVGCGNARLELPAGQLLLNGYSQGSVIAAAVLAQLPSSLLRRTAVVTVGSPLRRLYGRAFPSYFGPQCLVDLRGSLTVQRESEPDVVRWRNPRRRTDYIGSYIFTEVVGVETPRPLGVDRRVLDPPILLPDATPTGPPVHEHSDFWPDPQVAAETEALLRELDWPHPGVAPGRCGKRRWRS